MPRRATILGPLLVAGAAIGMLAWTWGTWPDPLVDFGTHCYVPWRLSAGDVLYRDVALYNGPLSSYANAAVFKLIGVGIHRLELANGLVLLAAMGLVYRLALRAAGQATATVGGLTFALVFAFGQGVGIGNYNWMTPYAHELTHGVTLGLLAIACLDRALRTDRTRWAVVAGAAAGAAFLTKIEPAVATLAAIAVQSAAAIWADGRRRWRTVLAMVGATVAVPILAAALLACAMPLPMAIRGTLGSWPWAFDRRVTSLPFYRHLSGLDDLAGNLRSMAEWAAVYMALFVASIFLGRRRVGRATPAIAGVLCAVVVAVAFRSVRWADALSPLPLVLCVAGVAAAVPIVRRRGGTPLRLALVAFAFALLGKILLRVEPIRYGFALALPGTVVLIAIVADLLPAWIDRRGGNGAIVRAVGLPVWLAFVIATLGVQSQLMSRATATVMADGPDSFRSASRGREVELAVQWIDQHVPPDGTVAVLPQGLMVNYLARRSTPTRHVNFMPPEVLAAGETTMLDALRRHPPDVVVIDGSAFHDGQFTLDGTYSWGQATAEWVRERYRPVRRISLPPPAETFYGFVILTRRP